MKVGGRIARKQRDFMHAVGLEGGESIKPEGGANVGNRGLKKARVNTLKELQKEGAGKPVCGKKLQNCGSKKPEQAIYSGRAYTDSTTEWSPLSASHQLI